jgi:hypothetical protein
MKTEAGDVPGRPVAARCRLSPRLRPLFSFPTRVADRFPESLERSLSGKTIIAACVFFCAWAVLAVAMRRSDPPWKPVVYATAALIALGLLMTFPTFFEAFAPE